MSLFLRILVMAFAWLVFFLVTFYGCIKPECCDGLAITETTTPVVPTDGPDDAVVVDDLALATTLNDGTVLAGTDWGALRNDLLSRYADNPEQRLQVTGNYYAAEPTPTGFDNMGMMRAEQIRALLVPDIPSDRIDLAAYQLSGDAPPPADRWQAGSFDWSNTGAGAGEEEQAEIIQLSENEIKIRFPFNAAVKDVDPAVDDYLDKLARRLSQTNERATIVGHTDNIGSDAANQRLGLQRANYIRDILVRNGAPAGRITTQSRGESDPEATNETEEGRRKNRRAVVTLVGE